MEHSQAPVSKQLGLFELASQHYSTALSQAKGCRHIAQVMRRNGGGIAWYTDEFKFWMKRARKWIQYARKVRTDLIKYKEPRHGRRNYR